MLYVGLLSTATTMLGQLGVTIQKVLHTNTTAKAFLHCSG